MLVKESMNPRRLGVCRLLFFAVSPQEQPFEPDPHLLKVYVKRACRVRENFAEMIEFVYKQLEDCCDQADRSAFSFEGKCAVDMTEAEICSSSAQGSWNVTEDWRRRLWTWLGCCFHLYGARSLQHCPRKQRVFPSRFVSRGLTCCRYDRSRPGSSGF